MANAGLAAVLAGTFTVFNYDRRGRGLSGDTQLYAVAREVEDIVAVIAAAGGWPIGAGTSSGAALPTPPSGVAVDKLALWEPPHSDLPLTAARHRRHLRRFVVEGRRDAAVGTRGQSFACHELSRSRRLQPWWAGQEAIAHTPAYDAEAAGDTSSRPTAPRRSRPHADPDRCASFPFFRETAEAPGLSPTRTRAC
jgi:hypothetical protein